MYYEDNVKIKIDWKGLILKLIAVVLIIILFIWLFPMPKLDTFYSRIYNENLNTMKEAAENYFVKDKLPEKTGASNTIKLQEMIDKKLITEFTDKNNKECSTTNSFAQVTKTENDNYVLKIQLSCEDKTDYVLENLNTTVVATTTSNNNSSNNNSNNNNSNNGSSLINKNTKDEDDGIKIDESIINSSDSKYDKGASVEYEYKRAVTKTTTTYVCPEGYLRENNACYKYESGETIPATPLYFDDVVVTKDAKENKSGGYTKTADYIKTEVKSEDICPEGYTKNGSICYKYVNATVVPGTTTYSCPDGYKLNGKTCVSTVARIENKTTNVSCPSGYTINSDKTKCTSIVNASKQTTNGSTSCWCPSGYNDNGNNCSKTDTYNGTYHAGSTQYGSCPGGWSESGSQCVRAAEASSSWSNPSYTTSSTQLSEYNNGSSRRVLVSTNCSARGCQYTYASSTLQTTYHCSSGSQSGSSCYTARPTYQTSAYYTCSDGSTQPSPTCYYTAYADKQCSTTPGTTTYSCPSGYDRKGDQCIRIIDVQKDTKSSYSCPAGYSMNGTECTKTIDATAKTSETQYTCPTGYVREGTTCYQYTEPTTKKTYRYDCPTGYKKEGDGENTKCTLTVEDTSTLYCEDKDEQLVDGKCIKTIKGGLKGYDCPSGYILNGDKCVQRSKECIDMVAVNNTSTSYEYKWSTETYLEGWTQTGKTRGIQNQSQENLYDK